VQAVSEEPVTLHVKVREAPAATVAELGATATVTVGGGAVTVTVATSVLVVSARLVATT
jgi:hypothetical protein